MININPYIHLNQLITLHCLCLPSELNHRLIDLTKISFIFIIGHLILRRLLTISRLLIISGILAKNSLGILVHNL